MKSAWIPLMMLVILLPVPAGMAAQHPGGDEERYRTLQTYLTRHRLDRLAIRLNEIRLAREIDNDRRAEFASELAEQYTRQFYNDVSVRQTWQFVARAQRLIRSCPETPMPNLQLAVAHALFLDAESAFLQWWRQGASPESRDELQQEFEQVQGLLQEQIRLNQQLAENQALGFLAADAGDRWTRRHQAAAIENRLLHASYLAGWTDYFLSVIPAEIDLAMLDRARRAFYRSLEIEQQKPIEQINPKWLDFNSPSSDLALLGLAMVYTAQQQWASAEFCFESFAQTGRDPGDLPLWRYNSLAFSRQWDKAVEFAERSETDQLDARARILFWQAVANAGCAAREIDPRAGNRLLRQGLLQLLRMFEIEPIRRIVSDNHLDLQDGVFEDLWMQGFLLLQPDDDDVARIEPRIEQAKSPLQSALEIKSEAHDPDDIDRIRYLLALAEYQTDRPDAALSQLATLSGQLMAADAAFAEKVDWLKCRSLIRRSQSDLTAKNQALSQIDEFIRRHPDSRFTPTFEFDRIRISCSLLPPRQALTRLRQISPGNPHYSDSRFEMVRHQHRLWQLAFKRHQASESPAYQELVEFDRLYRQLPDVQADQKLSSILLVVDAALQRSTTESGIEELLRIAEATSADQAEPDLRYQSRLKYYRFLAARKHGDEERAIAMADWLSSQATESAYQVQALAFLADEAEQSGFTSPDELIPLYERLANLLGTDPESIARSRNARVASNRLVGLYLQENRLDSAQRINRVLLEFNPDHAQYLLDSARIETRRGNDAVAAGTWRKLAGGSEPGSDLWLESKLGLVSCLMDTDPETALQILRQTISLSGELSEPWQLRFQEMKDRLIEKSDSGLPIQQ